MLADYLKAAIPTPAIILGQRLRKFSLGHNKILLRHESGFLTEADDAEPASQREADYHKGFIKPGDLELAIFVCCHEYDEALEAIEDPKLPELLMEWGKRCGEFDYRAKCRAFMEYLAAGSALPELLPLEEGKGDRTPGAPFLQLVKVTATSKLGYSRQEALNCPLGEVLHDYFAYYEQEGRAKILGPDEAAHFDNIADVKKAIEAEGGWNVVV